MNEKFGQFVRNKREEKKVNLRKLAEILDIAPAYMSVWKRLGDIRR